MRTSEVNITLRKYSMDKNPVMPVIQYWFGHWVYKSPTNYSGLWVVNKLLSRKKTIGNLDDRIIIKVYWIMQLQGLPL